jgi:hypothetical protein
MERDSLDGRLERAKDAALGPHKGEPTVADLVGEAAGGITGVLAGAAIGSIAGPVGTVIGGIAGAVGGWWGGRAISEAVERLTEDDETYWRRHHAQHRPSPAGESAPTFEDARPAYHLGHIAGMNPEYQGREFEEVETELQRGWSDDVRSRYGEWDAVRGYVEAGFTRRREASGRSSGELAPAEPAREPADRPARDADETARDRADRVVPKADEAAGGESDAERGRSIPRGTDEEGPRPDGPRP